MRSYSSRSPRSSAASAAAAAGAIGVEDAEQRVAARGDQLRVVEVVARVEADALRQAPADLDLARGVEQRDLDAVDLVGVVADDAEHDLGGPVEVRRAPVAGERRVEHVAEPVQDRRALELAQHGAVDLAVVVGRRGDRGQCAAGHDDDLRARALDELALVLVGGADLVERARLRVVGRRPGREAPAALGRRAPDQLARRGPVETHAALGGVHRLGHAEPVRPQVAAEGERRLPVDAAVLAGGHVRGGEGDARHSGGTSR